MLIELGSMSICALREFGENASSRPVMRSSKRAPMQNIASQPCMAMFASYMPCMPSIPSHSLPEAG